MQVRARWPRQAPRPIGGGPSSLWRRAAAPAAGGAAATRGGRKLNGCSGLLHRAAVPFTPSQGVCSASPHVLMSKTMFSPIASSFHAAGVDGAVSSGSGGGGCRGCRSRRQQQPLALARGKPQRRLARRQTAAAGGVANSSGGGSAGACCSATHESSRSAHALLLAAAAATLSRPALRLHRRSPCWAACTRMAAPAASCLVACPPRRTPA